MNNQQIPFHSFDAESSTDRKLREQYSIDASIFQVMPKGVLFPEDSSQVMSSVRRVTKLVNQGISASLSVRSAGTCMSGGSLTDSIVMDVTRYMNRIGKSTSPQPIIETNIQGEKILTAQPGVYYRDFESFTHGQGLEMPVYPASHNLCALGGMFGNNCGGEKSLLYGKASNFIDSTRHVFSDGNEYVVSRLSKEALQHKMNSETFEGNLYKQLYTLIQNNWSIIEKNKPAVAKNSAGYYLWNVIDTETGDFDMNQLLCGAQGTLGIATEITWKLTSVPKSAKMIVVMLPDLAHLGDLVNTLLKYNPSSIESYDDASMKLAMRFFPDFISSLGLWRTIKLGLQFLPELGMMMTGGIPKLMMIAEFSGNTDEEIDRVIEKALVDIAQFKYKTRVPTSDNDEQKYWTIRRESFNLLRKHLSGKRTAPFIDDICVDPIFLPEFLPQLNELLKSYQLTYTIAGHAGNGNFHIIPLMNFKDPHTVEIIMELSDKVYQLVQHYHGSITAEHNDGIVRTPYLHYMFDNDMLALFEQVKNIFDPLNIFNPGKKVHGTTEFLQKHIKRE